MSSSQAKRTKDCECQRRYPRWRSPLLYFSDAQRIPHACFSCEDRTTTANKQVDYNKKLPVCEFTLFMVPSRDKCPSPSHTIGQYCRTLCGDVVAERSYGNSVQLSLENIASEIFFFLFLRHKRACWCWHQASSSWRTWHRPTGPRPACIGVRLSPMQTAL